MATLREVVSTLKEMAPPSLAESWDNVGLLVEPSVDVQRPVARVLLTNDLTEDVQQEAEDTDTDLIVAYHPPLFRPFKRITLDTWKGRIVSRCLSRGIAVYSPHTSWDTVHDGLTDWLIGCFDGAVSPITPQNVSPDFGYVATLTSAARHDGERILAMFEHETGPEAYIEKDYYKVLDRGQTQLQLLCNSTVLSSLNEFAASRDLRLHVNKNESLPRSRSTAGSGRYCRFNNATTIRDVVRTVKGHLGVDNLMIALARGSTMDSTINSAAAVAGSGPLSLLREAKVDLYLTGEMSHHDLLDAVHDRVTVVLANHSNTERNYLKVFAGRLLEKMPRLNVRVSEADRDPLTFV